jgi:hypothetical protein
MWGVDAVELALSFPCQKYLPARLIGVIAGVHMPCSVSRQTWKIDGMSKSLFERLKVIASDFLADEDDHIE